MTRARKILLSALVVGLAGLIVAVGSYSLFSETTANASNEFVSNITLGDSDAGEPLFTLDSADLDQPRCIRVTYQGPIEATVRLYGSVSGVGTPYLRLTVTRGAMASGSFPSCAGFKSDSTDYVGSGAGVIYSAALSDYPSSYEDGVTDPRDGSPASWTDGQTHTYRFSIARTDADSAPAGEASATFSWAAKSK